VTREKPPPRDPPLNPDPFDLLCVLDREDFRSSRDAFLGIIGEDRDAEGNPLDPQAAGLIFERAASDFERLVADSLTKGDREIELPVELAVMLAIALKGRQGRPRGRRPHDWDARFRTAWILRWARDRLAVLQAEGWRADRRLGRPSAVDKVSEEAEEEARRRGLSLSKRTIARDLRLLLAEERPASKVK
jgi:hypothetical protein